MGTARCLVGVLVVAVLLAASQSAFAQQVAQSLHVGVGLPVLAYVDASLEGSASMASGSSDVNALSWGIQNDAMLEVGYGIEDSLVVGATLRVGGTTFSGDQVDDQDISLTDIFLAPTIDLLLMPGSDFRPFLGASVGVLSMSLSSGGADTSLLGMQFLGRGGVRWFVIPTFSVDTWASLHYRFGTGQTESDALADPVDRTADGFGVALSLGISGWVR